MRRAFSFVVLALVPVCLAQAPPATEPAPSRPVFVSPAARLAAAKTAFLRNAGGGEVPFNVVSSGLEGWGRFRLVDSPSDADIVIEVTSPEDETTSKSSRTRVSASGRVEDTTTATRDLSSDAIKLTVRDARTHIVLWSASDRPKGGWHQRTRDDHLVESAARLVRMFRERLEPPPPKP